MVDRALLFAAFVSLGLALTLAPVRANKLDGYVGEDCRQDDCERIWINNFSDLGNSVHKTSVRIASYHAEIDQEKPNYTDVTDYIYLVSCSKDEPYTQGEGEPRYRYPEYRDDVRYDQESELRDDIWQAVCESKYDDGS